MKRPYEITLVLRILSNDDETQAALDQVVAYIEANNPATNEPYGQVTRIDRTTLGRRKLAYEIQGQRDGYYVLVLANIEPKHLPELELNLKLYSPLLRFLIIRDEDSERHGQTTYKPRADVKLAEDDDDDDSDEDDEDFDDSEE